MHKRKAATSRTRPVRKKRPLLPDAPDSKITTWLLVADGAQAVLYNVAPQTFRLSAVDDGRMKQRNKPSRMLISSGPGHGATRGVGRRHALELRSDPHDRAETSFIGTVAERLGVFRREKRFDRLIIVAPPHAMHDLRRTLSAPVRKAVAAELTHEWIKLGVREMALRLKTAFGQAE